MSNHPLAVTFVHGTEISDPGFAKTATDKLRRAFERHANADADEALIIEPTYWAPELQTIQDQLFERCFGANAEGFRDRLTDWVTRINAGSGAHLLLLAATAPLRWVPGAPGLDYPTLRWLVVQFLGDTIAYQMTPSDRELYDKIHGRVAETLGRLADRAGGTAPLCVISHSLGTVIASNYFYDLEIQHGGTGRQMVAESVDARIGDTALERGETLAFLYTLGSPIPLWTQRYPDFGVPLTMPAKDLRRHHKALDGEWVNFYSHDDLISHPIKMLSAAYQKQVTEDRAVSVGPVWASRTPLSHISYWNDDRVIDQIAGSLASGWEQINRSAKK
jgi:hypothetical protein